MNTHEGYSKKTISNANVLLAGGGDKALSNFIGGIQYVSASKKIQYKTAADNASWQDLVTLITANDNIASATKLQTSRMIWGQPFDGSADVNGTFYFTNGDATMKIYGVESTLASFGNERVAIQTSFDGQDPLTSTYPTTYPQRAALLLQPRGGYIGIGTTSPLYKLHINGDAAVSSKLFISGGQVTNDSKGIQINASDSTTRALFVYNGNTLDIDNGYLKIAAPLGNIALMPVGGVGIGTTLPSYKLHVNGDVCTEGVLHTKNVFEVYNGDSSTKQSAYMRFTRNGVNGDDYAALGWNGNHVRLCAMGGTGNYTSEQDLMLVSWSKQLQLQAPQGTAPLVTNSTTLCSNLNADLLDGVHVQSWDGIPVVKDDGVMEIGRYIDFHYDSTDTRDYAVRLQVTNSSGSYGLILQAKSGTIALLSDITGGSGNYLPLSGGTMVGTISAADDAYSGGGFHSGYANIILRGNGTTGTSAIVFSSSKDNTSINRPTDCGFIQFHPYGVTAAAIGTNPTIGSSGESNKLVIGVNNDSDDLVWLLTPNVNGLKHVVGTNIYTIAHTPIVSTASSVTSLNINSDIIYATISTSLTLGLSGTLTTGKALTVVVYNSGSSSINITVPSGWRSLDGSTLAIGGTKYGEISIMCYLASTYLVSSKIQ